MATQTTPAPWRRRYTEDELLDAALATFDASGYHAAQIADIATAAGTTKPTLYARLGSKEEIYLRLVEREAERFKTLLASAYQQAAALPLTELVGLSVSAFFDFARNERPSFDLLFRSEPGRPGPEIGRRAVDEVIDHIAELGAAVYVRTGRAPGPSVELLAAAHAGVAVQVCLYAIDHERDLDEAEKLAAAYIEGAQRGIDLGLLAEIDRP
jgi:AcrR family transcriptional regulator